MDLKEAFYKQKEELHQQQREVRKLERALAKASRETAADERVQKLLSNVQGLKNKVSEVTGIMNRYKALYERQQKLCKEKESQIMELEWKIRDLQDQLDYFEDTKSMTKLTTSDESKAEIAALKNEVARLSAMLSMNSTNAGISTAKTAIDQKKRIPNSRKKSGLKKGGQPGHKKHAMTSFFDEELTATVKHTLDSCPKCGSQDLDNINTVIKDEYDYQVVVKKVRHKFIEYKCPVCGAIVKSPYNGLVAQNQYGNVIQSMALSLMDLGFVSINRTRKILSGFCPEHISLSEGYLCKLQKRYSKKLRGFGLEVKQLLVLASLIYWDDTVIFIDTARACMRFYGTEKLALYTAHLHKDLKGLMDDNVLPSLSSATTVMHDHNTINYHDGFVFRNVECLQHLERDLQKIIDVSHHSWAEQLKKIITQKLHERKELMDAGVTGFSTVQISSFLKQVNDILKKAWTEWSVDQNRYYSNEEKALINRLQTYNQNYFEWVKDFSIPTTNNLSERSLRFVKTKDKVSGQFQNIENAKYFADIRTYLETCSRNGVNEFKALLRLTEGKPYTVTELLSAT